MTAGKLQVDAAALLAAMADATSGVTWYLDRETGEVLAEGGGPAGAGWSVPEPHRSRLRGDDPERYVPIEPIRSSRAWRIMADFVDGLPPSAGARALARVLRNRKPFAGFERALEGYPEIRDEWLRFRELTYRQMAEDWLDLEEIDAELAGG